METMPATLPAQQQPKSRKKAILISLGVIAATVGGWFGWQYYKRKKQENSSAEKSEPDSEKEPSKYAAPPSTYNTPRTIMPVRNDNLPLKKGSKGERVRQLQQALISKYGKSILPVYGADGDFGKEMTAALEKLKLPVVVDESLFNILTKGGGALDAKAVAKEFSEAINEKNIDKAKVALAKLKTTADYTAVSDILKTTHYFNGVRKTLVNALLDGFSDEKDKDEIRLEFRRIGLKYDGKKWSLSGIESRLIITTVPTEIIDPRHRVKVKVPANMVLGRFIRTIQDWTQFKSLQANKKLIVKTSTIQFYETH